MFSPLVNHTDPTLAEITPAKTIKEAGKEPPALIGIPRMEFLLPVMTAPLQDDQWLLTNQRTAFYGEKSATPGEKGATVIFAHAREGLFSILPLVEKGTEIVLFTNTHIYTYTITEREIVKPEDVHITVQEKEHALVLFTCYGMNDAYRLVLFGKFTKTMPRQPIDNSLYEI